MSPYDESWTLLNHIATQGEFKMSWNLGKMLKQIDDYFDNVSQEEFEKALEKAGFGVIEPASESGYRLAEPNEVDKNA